MLTGAASRAWFVGNRLYRNSRQHRIHTSLPDEGLPTFFTVVPHGTRSWATFSGDNNVAARAAPSRFPGDHLMESCTANGQFLFSTLAEDPDLAEIVEMFVDEMPERVETILNCFQSEDWEGLRRASHQLKGAAGSYGFPSITPCAGVLEAAVKQARPETEIRKAVDELVAMCRSIRAGTPA